MIVFWIIFFALVLVLLALDLGVFNREAHVISVREAAGWTVVWVAVSLLFNGFVWLAYHNHWFDSGLGPNGEVLRSGGQAALEFFTGYLVEKSLSVDNIFVIALIFTYFRVPGQYQHRVLFWGILGAIILRGVMIGLGSVLVAQFSWTFYVFGGFLVLVALKMLFLEDETRDPEKGLVLRIARRVLPVAEGFHGEHFMVRVDGKRLFTTMFVVLIVIETTDLVFAVDSIPAIFGIFDDPKNVDPFIIMSSNIFAILGLRALYFVLAGMIDKFRYLSYSLAFVLAFVGVKMFTHSMEPKPISNVTSLIVIVSALTIGVVISILMDRREAGQDEPEAAAPEPEEEEEEEEAVH